MAQSKTTSPTDGVKAAFQDALGALGDRAMHTAKQRVTGLTDKLTDFAEGDGMGKKIVAEAAKEGAQGGSPVKGAMKGAVSAGKDKVTDALPGGGGGKGGGKRKPPAATKAMNIVESIDVGVPVGVAFNQWTQYDQWPSFMKKVEQADLDDDSADVDLKLKVFWFHRTQQSSIQDQIPDERIVWRSKGQKGHLDGCVTFHEIGPRLTRILVTLEYYPQGFVERVGNIWRAQGRRLRLELKHFRRHVMMHTILNPDESEGWRGEIEDSEVIRSHDEVVEEENSQDEQRDDGGDQEDERNQDRGQSRDEAEGDDEQDADEADEPDDEAEDEANEPDDELDDEPHDEPDDEADEPDDAADEPEDDRDRSAAR